MENSHIKPRLHVCSDFLFVFNFQWTDVVVNLSIAHSRIATPEVQIELLDDLCLGRKRERERAHDRI